MARTIDLRMLVPMACHKRHDTERAPYVRGIVKSAFRIWLWRTCEMFKSFTAGIGRQSIVCAAMASPLYFFSVTESGKGRNCSRLIVATSSSLFTCIPTSAGPESDMMFRRLKHIKGVLQLSCSNIPLIQQELYVDVMCDRLELAFSRSMHDIDISSANLKHYAASWNQDGVHSHKHQPWLDSSCREILGVKEAVYKKPHICIYIYTALQQI